MLNFRKMINPIRKVSFTNKFINLPLANYSKFYFSSQNSTDIFHRDHHDNKIVPIYRFCLTGGPCAGKTTSLATIKTVIEKYGFKMYNVTEAASLMINAGTKPDFTLKNNQDNIDFF